MLEQLKEAVCRENLNLVKHGLVVFTWGNVSAIDEERKHVVIKPSGVEYDRLTPESMVVVDATSGETIEGSLNPSSDTPTHLELYRTFPGIGGVVHTHSRWATIFAQLEMGIPPLGTTHADYFYGAVPCTKQLTDAQIQGEYERETGRVIADAFKGKDPMELPAALVAGHGPFAWGRDAKEALHNAVVLEEVAFIAWHCLAMWADIPDIKQSLLDKHYMRKHGKDAYYGQG